MPVLRCHKPPLYLRKQNYWCGSRTADGKRYNTIRLAFKYLSPMELGHCDLSSNWTGRVSYGGVSTRLLSRQAWSNSFVMACPVSSRLLIALWWARNLPLSSKVGDANVALISHRPKKPFIILETVQKATFTPDPNINTGSEMIIPDNWFSHSPDCTRDWKVRYFAPRKCF